MIKTLFSDVITNRLIFIEPRVKIFSIHNCLFSYLLTYTNRDGGAIYINLSNDILLEELKISNSIFSYCYCHDNGGAIFLNTKDPANALINNTLFLQTSASNGFVLFTNANTTMHQCASCSIIEPKGFFSYFISNDIYFRFYNETNVQSQNAGIYSNAGFATDITYAVYDRLSSVNTLVTVFGENLTLSHICFANSVTQCQYFIAFLGSNQTKTLVFESCSFTNVYPFLSTTTDVKFVNCVFDIDRPDLYSFDNCSFNTTVEKVEYIPETLLDLTTKKKTHIEYENADAYFANLDDGGLIVNNCVFSYITANNNPGIAITVKSVKFEMKIENCLFHNLSFNGMIPYSSVVCLLFDNGGMNMSKCCFYSIADGRMNIMYKGYGCDYININQVSVSLYISSSFFFFSGSTITNYISGFNSSYVETFSTMFAQSSERISIKDALITKGDTFDSKTRGQIIQANSKVNITRMFVSNINSASYIISILDLLLKESVFRDIHLQKNKKFYCKYLKIINCTFDILSYDSVELMTSNVVTGTKGTMIPMKIVQLDECNNFINKEKSLNMSLIITTSAIGGVLLLAFIVLFVIWCIKKKAADKIEKSVTLEETLAVDFG